MFGNNYILEIRVKGNPRTPDNLSPIITYMEVLSKDESLAKEIGFEKFKVESERKPVLRSILNLYHVTAEDCEAVNPKVIV